MSGLKPFSQPAHHQILCTVEIANVFLRHGGAKAGDVAHQGSAEGIGLAAVKARHGAVFAEHLLWCHRRALVMAPLADVGLHRSGMVQEPVVVHIPLQRFRQPFLQPAGHRIG